VTAAGDPAAWLRDGTLAHKRGDVDAAQALYRKVLAREPDNVHAQFLLGTIHAHRQEPDAAGQLLRRVVAAVPGHAPAHLLLGHLARAGGRPAEAVESYRRAAEADPTSGSAQVVLGQALAAAGDLAGAEAACAHAVALEPGNPAAHLALTQVLQEAERYPEAEAAGRKLVALRPDAPAAHLALARVLRDAKRYPEAEAACREALAAHPDAADAATAQRELGVVLTLAGRHADAVPHLEAALAANPDDVAARAALGDAHRGRGRFAEAIDCYAAVLAQRPDEREMHLKYGLVLKELRADGRGALLDRLGEDHVWADPAESLAHARALAEGLPYPDPAPRAALAAFLDAFDPGEAHPAAWWRNVLARFGPAEAGHDKLLRAVFASVYGWSIPTREALEALADFAGGARIASYGAGRGYWEYLLGARLGRDVIASDLHLGHRFLPMEVADFATVRPDPADVLLLSWIENNDTVAGAAQALLERMVPGQGVAIVGEPPDERGRARTCGTAALFAFIGRAFRPAGELPLTTFSYLDERIVLLRRA
jgi:tetratricopeptide (TPR) repeat protein